MDDEYLKVSDVVERLKVTRQAVYNWISEGRLSAVRVGRGLRVSRRSLEAFIQPVRPGEQLVDEETEPGHWEPELMAA
jgi:excisionase family DNA binding protein